MENYGLDPPHFYTTPGLAWQACLKKTGMKLDLITDPDMLLMFERGIRGGITQVVKRYAKANNKYMNDYNRKEPSRCLQYLDANNLYGWAMCQPLPTGEFKWADIEPEEVKELSVREDQGYLMEVDVLYPKESHDKQDDLPFMCGRMKFGGVDKLVADLYHKKRYVIHVRALQQALDHGLVLERIRRTIEFKQSPWMKEYIAFNTKLRMAAKDDFEKDLIVFNNKKFGDYVKEIYPSQLTVEKANTSDDLANYLDLTFIIESNNRLYTKLYDKRDDFDFHIVNFPFLSSNIPSSPSYGVYISQLIRYARCCSYYDDFGYRHKLLVDRLLSQGYEVKRLRNSFKKFYGRYPDLIEKYQRLVKIW